jgi:SAM-dependent methyltransferase
MSRFGPDPLSFFRGVYDAQAPWDIGGAQPGMAMLWDEFPPDSPVVDLGCGSGDHVIALAERGHRVIGVDFVDAAIALARSRVSDLPPDVADRIEFQVADGLRPSLLGLEPRSIVDSGFLHLFDHATVDSFVEDLALALPSGGRYYLLAFATEFPIPHGPRQISQDEVRSTFTHERGWRVLSLGSAEFLNRVGPPVPATSACIERL